MLMYSFKFNRRKVFFFICCALVLIAGIVMVISLTSGEMTQTGAKKLITVKTEEQRAAFIKQFGWDIDPEPAEVMEVLIPPQFDTVLSKYNEIQKAQGYDLTKYAGKTVKRWSYTVKNYPNKQDGVRISLLVYNNRVIGGDVACLELDGFMHGFAPEKGTTPTIVDADDLETTSTNAGDSALSEAGDIDVLDTEQLEADAETDSGSAVAADAEFPSD